MKRLILSLSAILVSLTAKAESLSPGQEEISAKSFASQGRSLSPDERAQFRNFLIEASGYLCLQNLENYVRAGATEAVKEAKGRTYIYREKDSLDHYSPVPLHKTMVKYQIPEGAVLKN